MIVKKDNNKLKNLFEYIFIIFTILQCNSVYFCHNKSLITIIWQLLLIIACFYIIISNSISNKNIYELSIIYMILSMVLLGIYYVFFPFSISYLFLFSIDPSLLLIFFSNILQRNEFNYSIFFKFENIMYILSIISLVGYLFYCLGVSTNSSITYSSGGHITRASGYFFINFFPTIGGKLFNLTLPIRNTGIFCEAPAYSYILSIALFIELFLNKKNSLYKELILVLTIVSTLSTNGYILAILAIVMKEISSHSNSIRKYLFVILIPLFLFLVKIIFDDKKSGDLSTTFITANSSYGVRVDNIRISIDAWSNHIFFGNGLRNDSSIYKYINPLRLLPGGDKSITTNFFEVLAYGGLFLALFYIIPTILSFFVSRNLFNFALFSFMYFMVEGIMYDYIYIMILSLCVASYLTLKFNHISNKDVPSYESSK